MRILFVCLGNICRSPLAEGLFRQRLLSLGIRENEQEGVVIDSAGTGDWHMGSPPDARSVRVAERYGIDLSSCRARKVVPEDFEHFDYVIAMDLDNLRALERLCPEDRRGRLHLLMSFVPGSRIKEIPDPYHFKDEAGFERVFATIADGVDGLIAKLHGAGRLMDWNKAGSS